MEGEVKGVSKTKETGVKTTWAAKQIEKDEENREGRGITRSRRNSTKPGSKISYWARRLFEKGRRTSGS